MVLALLGDRRGVAASPRRPFSSAEIERIPARATDRTVTEAAGSVCHLQRCDGHVLGDGAGSLAALGTLVSHALVDA